VAQAFGRTITKAAAHAPWTWTLLRGPVRRLFDSLAPGWDERTMATSEARLAPIAAALEHVERRPRSVLDIGTGTGTGAFLLAERYPEADVTGIDFSEAMIAKAREKAAARGTSIRFEVADIASYRPGATFDLVMLLNMPAFFERTAALVAPGGYVVTIASRGPTTPFYTAPETLDRGFGRRGLRTAAVDSFGGASYHVAERPPA
jgi:cyclopropane fatty-acyl-phospholipid synthase-like methyltransferase